MIPLQAQLQLVRETLRKLEARKSFYRSLRRSQS